MAVKREQPSEGRRRRGRPRSHAARRAILRAARELIEENGPTGVTVEGIAARAGVGKATIYRWWPDRHSVAMAALMDSAPTPTSKRAGGQSPLESLERQLRRIVALFATPVGRNVTTMIASADADSELARAFRNHFVLARRDEGRALLQQAVAAGEIRGAVDLEIVVDMIYGVLIFRLLMGHAPLTDALVDNVLKEALRGLIRAD